MLVTVMLAVGLPSAFPSAAAAANTRAHQHDAHWKKGNPHARQQQINLLRGANTPVPYNARQSALDAMAKQQATTAAVVSGPAWQPTGPAPIPNGQLDPAGTSGPVSGRVTSIAIDPKNSNTVFIGTAQGGVWRSLDAGQHWVPLTDQAQSLAIGALALAPSDPTKLYVGTGEANTSGDSFASVGIYRIDNADTTADLVGPIDTALTINYTSGAASVGPFDGAGIGAIVVDPNNAAIVFIATTYGQIGLSATCPFGCRAPPIAPYGLYRTTNGLSATAANPSLTTFQKLTVMAGNCFDSPCTGSFPVTGLALEPGNPNNLLATVQDYNNTNFGGVYRSTNALAATPTFSKSLAIANQDRASLAIDKSTSGVVTVLAAEGYTSGGKLWKSTDAGVNFSQVTTAPDFCGGQCWYNIGLAIDPKNPSIILLGGAYGYGAPTPINMSKSIDGGSTWTTVDYGVHTDTHAIAIAPSKSSVAFVGNDGGIWQSSDEGSNWNNRNGGGLSATQFVGVATHPTDPNFMIGGTQDNGTNRLDASGNWSHIQGGDGGDVQIDQTSSGTTNVVMYHTFSGPDVEVSANSGASWAQIFTGAASDSSLFYPPVVRGPGSPNAIYLGTTRVWRRAPDGTETSGSSFPAVISALGIAPPNDNERLVGLKNGHVYRGTTDLNTWTDVTGSWPLQYVARTVIDPNNVDVAYVTLDGYSGGTASNQQHVWKTLNLTSAMPTWSPAGSGIPDVPVNAFKIDPADSNTLFAGTDIGVYQSTNGGSNWTPFGTNLPKVAVFDLDVAQPGTASEELRAATHGRGIWQTAIRWTPLTATLTLPTTLTGTISATFSGDVHNVTTSDFVTRNRDGGVPVVAVLTCLNASNASVNCVTGPVRTAKLKPSAPLRPGDYYTAFVNPENAAGIWDATSHAVPPATTGFRAATSLNDNNNALKYGWQNVTDASALGGSYATDRLGGSAASFKFSGTSVNWITLTGPDQGIASVTIDGASKGSVDLYTPTKTYNVVRPYSGLTSALHTITINVTGTKNTLSTDAKVAIDGFTVGSTTTATPTLTIKWSSVANASASGGSYSDSDLSGSSVTITFRGTGISWNSVVGPAQGIETVTLDGVASGTRDDYATAMSFGNVWQLTGLTDATHTLVISVSGLKNTLSAGTHLGIDQFTVS